ncbi:hypothetical protein Hanom_Chr11g01001161 [Helianthus anomalus]
MRQESSNCRVLENLQFQLYMDKSSYFPTLIYIGSNYPDTLSAYLDTMCLVYASYRPIRGV